MLLTELTSIPAVALPVHVLREHLRLASGFVDDGAQDGLIASHLRAAIATIEGRIDKAIITRQFRFLLHSWRNGDEQPLPIAPVTAVLSVSMVTMAGVVTVLSGDQWRFEPDMQRPRLLASGPAFPVVAKGGRIEIILEAGFAQGWGAVPPDLAQAVLLLAAEFYENRHERDGRPYGLPFAVLSLIERWRTVRVLGGGGKMTIPPMKRRMILETPEMQPDGAGGYRLLWVGLGNLWVGVKTAVAQERHGASVPRAVTHYRFMVRAAVPGTPSCPRAEQRFRDGERIFTILAVSEADPEGRFLVCHTREEVAT